MSRFPIILLLLLASHTSLLAQPKKVDDHGDPLPDGALRRLGTVRLRYSNATGILLPADGDTIVVGAYKTCRVFDSKTGATRKTVTLPTGIDPKQYMFRFGETTILTPDGKRAIDLLPGGDVVRDLDSGQVVQYLKINRRNMIQHLSHAFTPDGRYLAIAGRSIELDGRKNPTAILYDLKTDEGKWQGSPEVNGLDVAIGPDAKRLIFYQGRRIVGWDTDKDVKLWSMVLTVDRVLIHPNGRMLLTLGLPAELNVRQIDTGALILVNLPDIAEAITALAWSPDGKLLAVAAGRQVILWDWIKGVELRRLPTGADHLAFSKDGGTLVTLRGVLQAWDLATGRPRFPQSDEDGHTDPVHDVLWSRDGKTLYTSSFARDYANRGKEASPRDYVFRWHIGSGKPSARLEGPIPGVAAFGHDDAGRVVAVTADRVARTWDAAGKQIATVKLIEPPYHVHGNIDSISHGRVLPGGKALLYATWYSKGTNREKAAAWDMKTGQPYVGFDPERKDKVDPGYPVFAWSVAGSGPERFDPFQYRKLPPLELPVGMLVGGSRWLEADHDLTMMGTRPPSQPFDSDEGGFGLWETATGQLVKHVPFKWIWQHAVTRDGRIAAFFQGGKLSFYDFAQDKMLPGWAVPSGTGWLFFSPDGALLANGKADGSILLWSVPSITPSQTPLTKADLDKAWEQLAVASAALAWPTIWRLVDRPVETLSYLQDKLRATEPISKEQLENWIGDLDAPSFQRREEAVRKLIELGQVGKAAVLDALKDPPTLERKRRLQTIVTSFDKILPPRGERLRGLRAVSILQRIGTPDAQRLLERLAKGDDMQCPTREAKAALQRLAAP